MTRIAWLDDIGRDDLTRVGGKGLSLARLATAGFDVPPAFVITTEATQELSDARGWPSALRKEVHAALKQLAPRGEDVAVRSSAVDEDSEAASFAGQYQTVLNVHGGKAFQEAVDRCLESLHAAPAVAYRRAAGIDESAAAMAIVVQRMVQPVLAGVAFSIDPVTGDRSRVVVEAVAGSGEALVSGQAEADRIVIDRESLAVLESYHAGEPVLTVELANEVAAAALRAETEFGAPQDIEFAHDGKQLWLLQSRPITTRIPEASEPGGWVNEFDTPTSTDVWTSANVQEILPGLLTPLTISVWEETVPRAYTDDYRRLKLLGKDENPDFMGVFYNRAFLNVTATRLIADRALGMSGDALEHRYLGGEYQVKAKSGHSRLIWKHRLLSAVPLVRTMLGLKKAAKRIDRQTLRFEQRVRSLDTASMSDADLDRWRVRLMDFGGRISSVHLQVTGIAGGAFEMVSRILQPTLGDRTEGIVPTLFTGMRGVESAQIGLDMWHLSRLAQRTGIRDRVREPAFDPYAGDLPKEWRQAFEAFMDRHGHRGINEMEASTRTWRHEPGPVVRVVASYLDLPEDQAPPATLDRQEAERLRLTAELKERMNPVKRALFTYILREAQALVALREHTKSVIVRAGRIADWQMPELQRRLVRAGIIESPDGVFFLTNPEIAAVLRGESSESRTGDVARRRRELERNRHVLLPERFTGRPAPLEPDLSHYRGDVLRGTPVSPGSVTGRARVILNPSTDGPMQPGEILVAPVTDAGWTPLFALASGLVVDMGSALSHGSTVAREYGLPAVVNVRSGTRTIKTGDLIRVDGTAGTVVILPEPAP